MQKKMAELSKFLTKLVLGICVVVFAVGLIEAVVLSKDPFSWKLLGNAGLKTFIAAIALAVAAIPEGLPAVVTIILSIGVTAMSKRQALIRKLTAVETLGCTQIIWTLAAYLRHKRLSPYSRIESAMDSAVPSSAQRCLRRFGL